MIEKTSNYIAAGAILSPAWLPSMAEVSSTAALLLPVLGCAWLVIQMIAWLLRR